MRPFFGGKALFCLKKSFKRVFAAGCLMEIGKLFPLNGVGNDRLENQTFFRIRKNTENCYTPSPKKRTAAEERMNREKVANLFKSMEETMIYGCLEGSMGVLAADADEDPQSAYAAAGDFCFFAGKPDEALIERALNALSAPFLSLGEESGAKLSKGSWAQRGNAVFAMP